MRTNLNGTGVCDCGCVGLLFAFPEHQIQDAADESHGEADPGQDVGGTVGALPEALHVKTVLLLRVDGCCDHHTQSCNREEDDRRQRLSVASRPEREVRSASSSAVNGTLC